MDWEKKIEQLDREIEQIEQKLELSRPKLKELKAEIKLAKNDKEKRVELLTELDAVYDARVKDKNSLYMKMAQKQEMLGIIEEEKAKRG